MGPTHPEALSTYSPAQKAERIEQVFGALRAESLRTDIFDLFSHPSYFPQLMGPTACVLVGGRGTGKTTVLKGLSYDGQKQLDPGKPFEQWTSIGLYWRVDTSMVSAFRGDELTAAQWSKMFSHYINVVMIQLIAEFLMWLEAEQGSLDVNAKTFRRVSESLGIRPIQSVAELLPAVDELFMELEQAINDLRLRDGLRLSLLGRPVRYLLSDLSQIAPLRGKYFSFLFDEYENLDSLQQRVINTLVKHSGDYPFTFKIGVKELGHRDRATLQPDEYLTAPADYSYIDIAEKLVDGDFTSFARSVCDNRLQRLREWFDVPMTIEELLPGLSTESEALRLGAEEQQFEIAERLIAQGATQEQMASFRAMPILSACLVGYWAESSQNSELAVLDEAMQKSRVWATRLNNYQHAMLFTLRRGRRGVRKYYSGWSTLVRLSHGNIRFLLQLVNESLQLHVQSGLDPSQPISADSQTRAAMNVGERSVEQLQGISANGRELTKLVLGLGRVFEVMATQPYGHAPEVSQFRVVGNPNPEADSLLEGAVMHLAVRRMPTDKRASISGEVKGYSYQLHPIFAAFFGYSHRSKRRMDLTGNDLLGLVSDHNQTIPRILSRSAREVDTPLPAQLALFRNYYGADHD